MKIIPIQTERLEINPVISIEEWITNSIEERKEALADGDILVLSSKIVSYFEGNIISLDSVKVSENAGTVAGKMNSKPELIQLTMDEADEIIAETPWVLLTQKNGIYTANAGIDLSNVPEGYAVTWPKNPFFSADKIRSALKARLKLMKLAVLIIDSACTPGRKGTVSIAIGYSGVEGYQELKGSRDLYNNVLRYSSLNRVDSLATAANLMMGESAESCPLAIIRNYKWEQNDHTKNDEMIISSSDEMFPLK